MEILQFINILLCMLMRHLMCKDMFSSMFMAQRASKGSVSSQSEAIAMFDSKSSLYSNILSSYTDSWNKIITFHDYLLDKLILCYTFILLVTSYLYKKLSSVDCNEIISCQVVTCDDCNVHYTKELPQGIIRIIKYCCSRVILISLAVAGLSLWWLNIFEISNIRNFSKALTIEEDGSCDCRSTLNNITLDDGDEITKLYYDHCSDVIFFPAFTTVNMTLFHSGLININSKLTHKKKFFKDYMLISETCFALEFTHWLFLHNTSLSLNKYYVNKYYSEQLRVQSQQNLHNNSLSAIARAVHNCCDGNIIMSSLWCNPYIMNCCISQLPSTGDLTIPLYDSPYVSEHHKVQTLPIDQCIPSLAVIVIAAFIILCWLSLKWKNKFLTFRLVMMFYSTTKSLIVNILNVTYQVKYFSLSDSCCDGMCCTCLGLKRILTLDPTDSSCTVNKPLLHNIKELPHNTTYDDSLSAAAADDDDDDDDDNDDEVLICREETGHDSYWTQEYMHEIHVFETYEHDNNHNEDVTELVIGTTGWTKGKHYIITASHNASDIRCSCASDGDDDIPLCIPSSDNSSHEVVSVSAGPILHYQAGYRNADHAFVQEEKNPVEGNLFSFSSPLGNTCETNISFENFRRSCYTDEIVSVQDSVNDTDPHVNTEIDVTEVTPLQEETNPSHHIKCDSDKVKNHTEDQPENAKGTEKDDDDDDSDDSDCTDGFEECCSVEESQPCDATNDDGVQCCSADSGELVLGTYTINKAYDAGHSTLSVNGQVIHVHTYSDTVRPIGGDQVSKPKASNNQPPAFEYTAYNRITVNQFNQQPASLAAANLPSGARTEHRHQQITSTDDTFDEDTFVEKDGRLRDDATPEEQRITTKDTTTYPNKSEQIQRIGPHYNDTKFREDAPLSYEEVKQNSKTKTTFLQHEVEDRSQQKQVVQNDHSVLPQVTHHNVTSNATSSKPKSLPKRSCIVVGNTRYPLAPYLLAHPRMDHFFVKERREIKPGHFLAKLVLQHSYLIMQNSDSEVNETATAAQQSQAAAIVADSVAEERDGAVTKRQHYAMNVNRTGCIVFSSDLTRFTGDIKYPLPGRKATTVKLGKGGNGFVFSMFHNGKEYAVKKTVYRPNEIRVHSQLAHVNLVNLEAVLIGEEHEHHKGKFYAFYFMNKLDMDFRSVISTKEHGCLKHLKLQLSEQRNVWEVVMVNVKYVLRSVLKALDYMHSQGLVHRDVKASNILLKMNCQCTKPLMCACPQKYSVKLGDFDSSTSVPGHGLNIEPHQLIRYASVLPLGTMGYRAPEVSMHLVISGPYEVLYTTGVDIWSFGCLLLNILIGKCGPLKQRGEASLLLSVQDQPYCEDLYNKIIKMKELQKYYSDIPEMIDLVRKCLQVKVHCRPTAKQLLQLDILQC